MGTAREVTVEHYLHRLDEITREANEILDTIHSLSLHTHTPHSPSPEAQAVLANYTARNRRKDRPCREQANPIEK